MSDLNTKSSGSKTEMTFFEHLDVLRKYIMRIAIAVVLFTILAFIFKEIIFDILILGPRRPDFPTNIILCNLGNLWNIPELCINQISFNIINTELAGQFRLHLSTSLTVGIILSVPYALWQIWLFVKPGLSKKEISKFKGFIFFSSFLFFTGVAFGYFIISPLTINFLINYETSSQITNLIDIHSYITTITAIVLASGVIFELPVLIFLLANLGVVGPGFLKKYRKHSIIIFFILAAIITPPDVFSQVLVALPLMGLYEYGIRITSRIEKRRKND
ncbi:MAG: twin-arginine translocase subunit TatC [Bacteroidales bacterium]|nr:twin-arginine translocase subunit TatC [Bacteroidales bacterium]